MNNTVHSERWDDYFKFRNVSKERYKDHRLPRYIEHNLPDDKRARIVDLGCGFGQNLSRIKALGYVNCIGIEPSKDAAVYAAASGLEIAHETIEQYADKNLQNADFVLMTHVLEHLPRENIIPTLRSIRDSILASGGRFLIAVPNASSVTHCYWRYEDWTHTCLFTSGSLSYVLMSAGFDQIKIIDPNCMLETRLFFRPFRWIALWCYKQWLKCLCRVTSSSFHKGSAMVFSFEVKALVRK